jgi:hypothetical protein
MDRGGPQVFIVAGAGAGIWTERGDRGSEAESGTQKKKKESKDTGFC